MFFNTNILKKLKSNTNKALATVAAAVLLFSAGSSVFAAPTDASLTLGDSRPGQETTYTFTATGLNNSQTIGCYELDFGTSSNGTGNVGISDGDTDVAVSSNGFDGTATTASFVNGSGEQIVRATNASPTAPSNATQSLVFSGLTNGNTADTSYFAVFTTYTDTSCTGGNEEDTIAIKFIYTDGQQVSLTVDPNFTFTVAGLANGVDVNGTNTTVDASSSPGEIPFGAVAANANSVVGQELTINTNAQSGYFIYVKYTGQLTGPAIIPDFAGPAPFSAAGTENFGFTSEDTDVLAAGNWDGLSTANQSIAQNTSPLSAAEATQVGYQVGVDLSTPAGSYATTVIYTAVPTY